MSALSSVDRPRLRWLNQLGLYAVAAFAVVVGVPRDLALPIEFPLGRFTLEGRAAQVVFAVWVGAWVLVVVGLLVRKAWGCRFALVVFGLHVLLVGSNTLRWLAVNEMPLGMAMQIGVWPSLHWILADLVAMAYLHQRMQVFAGPRGTA